MKPRTVFLTMSLLGCAVILGTGFAAYYDDENNLCVIASSKWLLIDTLNGKIAKIEKEMGDKYESEPDKSVFGEKDIEKLKVPNSFESSIKYKTKRKDIDVIGHVHNLYYLDLAYEALPEEVYNQRPFDNIRIMYKKEIKYGEIVICKYSKEQNKNVVVIESENGEILHAIVELF